jgi:hypothetical protein
MERSLGTFYPRLPLPFEVKLDQIQATMRDGVLEVRIPRPAEKKGRSQAHTGDIANSEGQSGRPTDWPLSMGYLRASMCQRWDLSQRVSPRFGAPERHVRANARCPHDAACRFCDWARSERSCVVRFR